MRVPRCALSFIWLLECPAGSFSTPLLTYASLWILLRPNSRAGFQLHGRTTLAAFTPTRSRQDEVSNRGRCGDWCAGNLGVQRLNRPEPTAAATTRRAHAGVHQLQRPQHYRAPASGWNRLSTAA